MLVSVLFRAGGGLRRRSLMCTAAFLKDVRRESKGADRRREREPFEDTTNAIDTPMMSAVAAAHQQNREREPRESTRRSKLTFLSSFFVFMIVDKY